ncbi:MAG: nitrous oxide reductase family maturation protein NosD [Chromatiales bacterium]|nr:nitrous oxide reductase family maturation protein NosD [Chromatiales bacterium]
MVINSAAAGDTIHFTPGNYRVNLYLDKSLVLEGEAEAILNGGGDGNVITVAASGVVIRNLKIVSSGHNLTEMNAGIFVERTADNVLIENNELDNNAFGIWLDASKGARVIGNRIHGEPHRRSQDRGNGVHMYATTDALVRGNEIWETRDGVYIDTSNHNTIEHNTMHDLRYGVHYMYSHHNKVIGNRTYNTRTGYALMQSKYLTVLNNRSEGDRNYGILMNFITNSEIADNRVIDVQVGAAYVTGGGDITGAEGKALFVYNSQFNQIHDNLFARSDIGIHLTAGSEDNTLFGNAFMGNRVQVKYVANRLQEWSHQGRGNFWSDYLGWDLNADGVGDKYYEPNDAVDKLLWRYPTARVLMNSPAVETLRWVQEQFPVFRPQGVRDSQPLMLSPLVEELNG